MVDGDALLRRAPERDRLAYFAEQVKRIVFDLGKERIAGIVGFSAGGIVGLQLMASMDPAWVARRPLCLLDTYAPRYNARRFSTRRRLVNLLHHPQETLQRLAARWRHAHGPEADDDGDAWAMTAAHEALQDDIARATLDPRGIRATLIRSTEAARRAGVLRRRGSNGFDASRFRSLAVVPVVMGHMDVIQRGSPEVAALVASALVASAPQAHAEVPC